MNLTVTSKLDLRSFYNRKALIFISLIFTVTMVFSCFISVFNDVSPFASGTPDKIVSNETELLDAVNNATEPTLIALDKYITLTQPLVIPTDKNITLTSNKINVFYKLIGPRENTIIVANQSTLTIKGIIVTHTGGIGCGVLVQGGTFIMVDGEISNNWGGVEILDMGSFTMLGGKISNNKQIHVYTSSAHWDGSGYGGGIWNGGNFTMLGGEISGNTAGFNGGGVYNTGNFTMLSGKIYNNKADNSGGVYNAGTFNRSGGVIFGNVDLMDSIIVVVVVVVVVVGILLFYFRKRLVRRKKIIRQNVVRAVC